MAFFNTMASSLMVPLRPAALLLIVLLFSGTCYAQLGEWYYSDTLPRNGGSVNQKRIEMADGVIISGMAFNESKYYPSITYVDTTGVIRWQYLFGATNSLVMGMVADSGGGIIATSGYGVNQLVVVRLSAQTGVPYFVANETISSFFDITLYDSTSFLIAVSSTSMNTQIRRLDISTGQSLSVNAVPSGFSTITDMELEPVSKDVFICSGSRVARIAPSGFTLTPWLVDYDPVYSIDEVDKLDYDAQSGQLFMYAERQSVFSAYHAKLNTQNGGIIWGLQTTIYSNVRCSDFKHFENYIITTWEHSTVGGGATVWQTMKVDTTGTLAWGLTYALTPVWTSTCAPNCKYSALSLDVDHTGDIYLTGYYCGYNWGPSNWGILKLDGANGNAIYQHTITLDSLEENVSGIGKTINVIGSRVYCLGMIETADLDGNFDSWQCSARYFVKMDLGGTILDRRFLQDMDNDNSTVIQIVPVGTDKYAVLKQIDRTIELDLFGYNRNLLWRKRIAHPHQLLAHSMQVLKNGLLCVNAYSGEKLQYANFFALDSIHTYQFDTAGQVAAHFQYRPAIFPSIYFTPLLFANDSDFTYALIRENNNGDMYLAKYNASVALPEAQVTISLTGNIIPQNSLVNYSAVALRLLWQGRILVIDKATLTVSSNILNGSYKINNVYRINPDNVLIAGFTGSTMNQWQGLVRSVNLNSNTVNWTVSTPLMTQAVVAVTDTLTQTAYVVISKHAPGDSSLYINKYNLQTGALLTTGTAYTYDTARRIFPNAIDFDACRNRLLVAADQNADFGNGAWAQPVFCTFDTSGTFINALIRAGDFAGANTATAVRFLPDGSVWGGGRLMHTTYGKAAFVFELDSALAGLQVTAGGPLLFCPGDSVMLTASGSGPWQWNTGDTGSTVIAYQPGAYQVQSTSGGCAQLYSAPVYVQWYNTPAAVITNISDTLYSSSGVSYQWYFNGILIPQATYPAYIPLQNGSYTVVVGYVNGCSDTSAPFVYAGVGVNVPASPGNVLLSPNPVNDHLRLQIPGNAEQFVQLRVISASGQCYLTDQVQGKKIANGFTLAVDALPPGMYILQLTGDHVTAVARFIVIR